MSFSCSSVASYGMFPTAETEDAAGQRGGYRPRRRGRGEPAFPRSSLPLSLCRSRSRPRGLTEHGAQGPIHGGVPHRQPRHRAARAASGPHTSRPPASASSRARNKHGSGALRKRSGGKRGTGGSGAGVPGLPGTPERECCGLGAAPAPRAGLRAAPPPQGCRFGHRPRRTAPGEPDTAWGSAGWKPRTPPSLSPSVSLRWPQSGGSPSASGEGQ